MKKRIVYLSLRISMGLLMMASHSHAAEILIANGDVFHDFRHEIEVAQAQAETAQARLREYADQKEAADIQAAMAHSMLDTLEQYIGGHPDIPLVTRLQGYLSTLGLDAATLEEAVGLLYNGLRGIPGADIVEQINHLKRDLTWLRNKNGKEQATKRALQRALAARDREQGEANQLLHHILCQLIPQDAPVPLDPQVPVLYVQELPLPLARVPAPNPLSIYQQRLLDQRQQGKIGDAAWRALGGGNQNLAATLCKVVQGNLGKTVEVFYLGDKNFKLRINNKDHHNPYTF